MKKKPGRPRVLSDDRRVLYIRIEPEDLAQLHNFAAWRSWNEGRAVTLREVLLDAVHADPRWAAFLRAKR